MLQVTQNSTVEEAGRDLLGFILDPSHWVVLDRLAMQPQERPGVNPNYQRRVGPISICASVDVTADLGVFLRIAFRGPKLTPVKAAEHLEAFLRTRLPLLPNTEWQVQIDERRWIHFIRRWVCDTLRA
ncbi:MAG TPA: hypothetical protein VND93_15225 [Myxococcales bacterium]|jgi:hypothetical protein|nr:hypothetical protein [Myxococcales bacterium]